MKVTFINKLTSSMIAALMMLFVTNTYGCMCINFFTVPKDLEELKQYDFIAYVKIVGDGDLKNAATANPYSVGLLTIRIIERFKGEKATQILEQDKRSSCDMGISAGDEWIFYANKNRDKLSVHACGRNLCFKRQNGKRNWRFEREFEELKQLRKLYRHPQEVFADGPYKRYYANGKLEIEDHYLKGRKNGWRKVFYPDGRLWGRAFYVNDSLHGKSEWFYPSGQLQFVQFNINGKYSNVYRVYYDSSVIKSKGVVVHYESQYDTRGRPIISKEFNQFGQLRREQVFDPKRDFSTIIWYHRNGLMEEISYYWKNKDYGHYQRFDSNGTPTSSWDYDEKGRVINRK